MSRAESQTAATVHEVVRVLLPEYPGLDAPVRSAVERDVSRYLAAQIALMPPFLRLPYRLALLAFEWAPLLRYGRPFGRLPAAARTAYVALWSDAPIAPMRDCVKLLRSSALLVYFDHPQVAPRLGIAPRRGAT